MTDNENQDKRTDTDTKRSLHVFHNDSINGISRLIPVSKDKPVDNSSESPKKE